ncbi:MAG: rubrerythrin [Candidatus Adiutrix intracellularis]|jgi:rubrerythrin|nr:MAG: rubrerythrin [Candidatus Adiutrix intracellularis]MDR2827755.1 rubrerythrin family protein [Candidatus Adiutrix intracellularis]
MSKTTENLKAAFAGESQANRKYLAFAHKAEQEKKPYAARIFRAAAEAETVHAHAHLQALKAVAATEENLKEAIVGETFEFTDMYPDMIKAAQVEGDKTAERSMTLANEAEKIHAEFFKKALANPGQAATQIFICSVCGHVAEGHAPDTCPICGSKTRAYKEIA